MRTGYFLAQPISRRGDPELANICLLLWRSLHHRRPSKYDGVCIYESEGNTTVLVVRNGCNVDAFRGKINDRIPYYEGVVVKERKMK
jgi:hypothetical protein